MPSPNGASVAHQEASENASVISPMTPLTPRVLVPDSDTEDSLGPASSTVQKDSGGATSLPAFRIFSKRATHCAAALLERHDTSATLSQQQRCLAQLGRLGGAYRALAAGKPLTMWVPCGDLDARVIRETDAFFEGRMADRLTSPHVSRKNGVLRAESKRTLRRCGEGDSPGLTCGFRRPLPFIPNISSGMPVKDSTITDDAGHTTADYTLTNGEQFALSFLSMETDSVAKSAPRAPSGLFAGVLATDCSETCSNEETADHLPNTCSSGATPFWIYEDVDCRSTNSAETSPSSAAHAGESPSAARQQHKRGRDLHARADSLAPGRKARCAETRTARSLDFEGLTASCSQPSTVPGDDTAGESHMVPFSLSASVIEFQNHRVHRDLLRQQSLFAPF